MMRYVGTPPLATYQPGDPAVTKAQYDYGKSIQDLIIDDPTVGLVSETNQNKGAELAAMWTDAVNGIVSGKKPIASLDQTIQTWRQSGGDTIRQEFQDAIQKSSPS